MMNSKAKKKNKAHIAVYIILLSGVLITLLPFFWMLLTSLKTQSEAIRVPPVIFPAKPILSNYKDVFKDVPFAWMYLNTIISSVVTVTAQLLLCSMAAYAFAKLEFPGREIIFVTLLAVLMVPSSFFILRYSHSRLLLLSYCKRKESISKRSIMMPIDISKEPVRYIKAAESASRNKI